MLETQQLDKQADTAWLYDLTDGQLEAKLIVEEDERFERESEAFQARVRSFWASPDSDIERDAEHDSGEDLWRYDE